MILIFSSHLGEFTTDNVIDWLEIKQVQFKRINGVDLIKNKINISISDIEIYINNEIIILSNINVFWYRRLLPYNYFLSEYGNLTKSKILNFELIRNIQSEYYKIRDFIGYLYKDKKWLSKFDSSSLNKLEVLNFAMSFGLIIPETLITTSKKEILKFKEKHKNIIVKNISEVLGLPIDNKAYVSYTHLVDDNDFNNISSKIYPSLVQKNIFKIYELRIFYLNGSFSSMAIFSQNDDKTKTDFRVYNQEKPNRNVPYLLPKGVQEKLELLMNKLNLNCGSIDMIKSINGDYVFLEINPVGQFGMVSKPCNYFLEEKVADYLKELDIT